MSRVLTRFSYHLAICLKKDYYLHILLPQQQKRAPAASRCLWFFIEQRRDIVPTRLSTSVPDALREDNVRQLLNRVKLDLGKALARQRQPVLAILRRPKEYTFVIVPEDEDIPRELARLNWARSAATLPPFVATIDQLEVVFELLRSYGYQVHSARNVAECQMPCISYKILVTGNEPDLSTVTDL